MPEKLQNPEELEEQRHAQALAIASEAGHILLENGAEISRVEETMEASPHITAWIRRVSSC